MNKLIPKLFTIFIMLFFIGCGKSSNNPVTTAPTISFITITSPTTTVSVSNTIQFTATATYTDNTTKDITTETSWSSSNTAVGTINSIGIFTALSSGTTTIEAVGAKNSVTVTVTETSQTPTVSFVTITSTSSTVTVGGTIQFTATATYTDNTTKDITTETNWSSSNTAVGTINSIGIFTALSSGTTTIEEVGANNSITITVTTTPSYNNLPIAYASASSTTGIAPLTINFTGSGKDSDGYITKYEWDFNGDGIYDYSSTTTASTTYTYNIAGTYTAIFRVTDSESGTGTQSVNIVVIAAQPTIIAQQISAGKYHACALTSTGGVKCWGYNNDGQLGNGTTTDSLVPVDVSGLTNEVIRVSTGVNAYHNCAITSSGGVKCWGDNTYGQLGNGTTTTDSLVPVDVSGLANNIVDVSVGLTTTCAITSSGGVKCWGDNTYGQLGNGTTTDSLVPVDVFGLTSGVIQVSLGYSHTCALTTSGGVKCWGRNNYKQLGNNTMGSTIPTDVTDLTSGVIKIGTGVDYNCALTSFGSVKCWGIGYYLGIGETERNFYLPVDVFGLSSGVTNIAVGESDACAIKSSGEIKCWGMNGPMLGNSEFTEFAYTPITAIDLNNITITNISAGGLHMCAITPLGSVKCWGKNFSGQLGNGTTLSSSAPVDVAGF